MLFSKEVMEKLIRLHNSEGRAEWKYKPMTSNQYKYLSPYFDDETLSLIDRGAAAMLLPYVFSEMNMAEAY